MTRKKDEPAGSMLPLPLQFLAAWLAVWLGRVLQPGGRLPDGQEPDPARRRLGGGRMRFTDAERRRLRRAGQADGAESVGEGGDHREARNDSALVP